MRTFPEVERRQATMASRSAVLAEPGVNPLPSRPRQEKFLAVLRNAGVPATLRREKGHDIAAACGQLRLQTERALEADRSPATAVSDA